MASPPRIARHVAITALAATSVALAATRLYAATRIGFGDSEALYASYALHPQPAYLDHPGLVGVLARAIGGGTAPAPAASHVVTTLLAASLPWIMAGACRACGAPWPRAFAGALVIAVVPEAAVGLFAMTPDLLLALAWTSSIALAAYALRNAPGGARSAMAFAAAGVLGGVAAASKLTGLLLLLALGAAYASPPARSHRRSVAPWAGLAAGLLIFAPVVVFEVHKGWPMLVHRLVATQSSAGVSLRNAGALLGGQLLYLSPFVAVLAATSTRELWRARNDVAGRLLLLASAVPLAALLPLCLWSHVAEPHWLAPALLALVPAGTRAPAPCRSLVVGACTTAAGMVAVVYAWVLVPSSVRLAPASYDPRFDITNELYGWPAAVDAVRSEALASWTPGSERGDVVVVGPHWVVCAQLEAALRGELPVGCDTPVRDDFDDWWPRDRWRRANVLVWVTDARFGPPPELPAHATLRTRRVQIERGGRTVRVFTIAVLTRRAQA